jgi:hydroxysqualene synthase
LSQLFIQYQSGDKSPHSIHVCTIFPPLHKPNIILALKPSIQINEKSVSLEDAISGPPIMASSWSVDSSYRYCAQVAKSHYENFPVGSLLVPRKLRKHFYAIYAFARAADDFADESYDQGYSQAKRLDLLGRWREMLIDSRSGRAEHPVFIALSDTATRFELPTGLFEDLLSAFSQDVTTRRYNDFDQLLDYCSRSANPVGRLILLLFGHRDEQLHHWSDRICTGLQLANHWQDVAIDLEKDRVYLPRDDLQRFGLDPDTLQSQSASEGFRRLMQFEVARAKECFEQGKPLCVSVGGRLGLELRAVWLGGRGVLEMIEERGYDVFGSRPSLSGGQRLGILLKALQKRRFSGA